MSKMCWFIRNNALVARQGRVDISNDGEVIICDVEIACSGKVITFDPAINNKSTLYRWEYGRGVMDVSRYPFPLQNNSKRGRDHTTTVTLGDDYV